MTMLAVDGLLSILLLGFWLFCLFDVITADTTKVRNLPKVFWVLVVVLLFALGGLIWLLLGRPSESGWVPGRGGGDARPRGRGATHGQRQPQSQARRPLGPEDSPEYEERMRRTQERLFRRDDDSD